MPVEQRFVDALAKKALKRLTRRTIACLQKMKDGAVCGRHDSVLGNVWDEICVQVQYQESVLWTAYEDTVCMMVRRDLEHLSALELEAIWFQTDRGFDWWCDQNDADDQQPNGGDVTAPVCLDDIVELVMKEILDRAANWSNARIRAFIESSYEMD